MTIAKRYDDDTALFACPHCGRFVGKDPDGYYDAETPGQSEVLPDGSREILDGYIAAFCDERCACLHHGRPVPANYWRPTGAAT